MSQLGSASAWQAASAACSAGAVPAAEQHVLPERLPRAHLLEDVHRGLLAVLQEDAHAADACRASRSQFR